MIDTPLFDELINKNMIQKLDLPQLARLIEQVIRENPLNLQEVERERGKKLLLERFRSGEPLTLTLQAIPDISVTELGWTDVKSEDGKSISGPERTRLLQFLKHIQGSNFVEKINSLSSFYDNPDEAMATMFADKPDASQAERIAKTLSYMVFFKTLTKVISNFNAASAGFNFEAFLAVLMNGAQIAANTGTIADFISRADGSDVPVSLKLYQEGKLHVGGSFKDLVGDLTEPKFDHPFMRYVAVTKEFDGGEKEGLHINGTLYWFRFDFTLDNVLDILANSSSHSKQCVRLPAAIIEGVTDDFAATLPGTVIPSVEELEKVYVSAAQAEIADLNESLPENMRITPEIFKEILANLNWSTNDEIFHFFDPNIALRTRLKLKKTDPLPDGVELQPLYISRGNSRMPPSGRGSGNKAKFNNIVNAVLASLPQENFDSSSKVTSDIAKAVASRLAQANNLTKDTPSADISVMKLYSKSVLKDQRTAKLAEPNVFASIEDSVKYYNALDSQELKASALKQTYGYLMVEQFNLTQTMVAKVNTYSKSKVLPEGQSSPLFGKILIGANNTQNMLNRIVSMLNEAIFDIFISVKEVQDNTYSFVAGGMRDNNTAEAAISASESIIEKTRELKAPNKESEQG